jgi:hypothetical protein
MLRGRQAGENMFRGRELGDNMLRGKEAGENMLRERDAGGNRGSEVENRYRRASLEPRRNIEKQLRTCSSRRLHGNMETSR